jgi:hypothetical protein
MPRPLTAAIVGLLVGCGHADAPREAHPQATHTQETPMAEPELEVVADPTITAVDGAEPPTLAPAEWLRYQVISLAKGCRGNYRFIVRRDGAVLFARNRRSDCTPPERFDVPYPAAPTATLDSAARASLAATIERVQFFQLAPGWRNRGGVDDGAMAILDVAGPSGPHRVVVQQGGHPAVKAIHDAVMAHVR